MLLRSILLSIHTLLVVLCTAQAIHHYQAQVGGLTSTLQEKLLAQDLHDRDPLSEIQVDRIEGSVEWKTTLVYDHFKFELSLQRHHLPLLSFEEVGIPDRQVPLTDPRDPRVPDKPTYIETGDRIRDAQRYDAYKAAWIAMYPEQYRLWTAPVAIPEQSKAPSQ